MGVPEMSLINKMLQDLEQRHSDAGAKDAVFAHVRPAPQRQGMHVAWWIALGLLLILTAAVSWFWGRETAPPSAQPRLALKLDADLNLPKSTLPGSKDAGRSESIPPPAAPAMDVPSYAAASSPGEPRTSPPDPIATALNNAAPVTMAPAETPRAAEPLLASSPPQKLAVVKSAQRGESAKLVPALSAKANPDAAPVVKAIAPPVPAMAATRARQDAADAGKTTGESEPVPNVVKQVKETTPQQRAENEYRRGMLLIQQSRSADGAAALEHALQIDPLHATARQALAGVLMDARRPDEAMRRLQEGLTADRSQTGLAMMYARLQVEKGELRPAIDTLNRTLPYALERADYRAFVAALMQRDGNHREAIDHYLAALKKAPQNGLWWMGIGISLQAENRSGEARDAFSRAKASNMLSPELAAFVDQKLSQLR
jgi:MSHA biogenesis protein MshN